MVKVVKLEIWWEKKVLKIVYINNIYYLYILSLGEKNTFKNRVWPLWPWPLWPHLYYFQKLQCSATDIIRKKSKFVYSTHTQQLTALFLVIFELLCLTSYPRFWTNSRKMYYLCRRKAALGNLKASFHCARLHFLCTVNQWKCSGSLAGGIYYDQGRSQ